MAKRRSILNEFYSFLRENKAYWMAPIIIAILLLAGLIVLGAMGGGAAAPFIYTLFQMMPFVTLNWRPNRKQLRQFGAVFMGGFVLIGLIKYFWPFERLITRNETLGTWLIVMGLVVGGIGLTGSRLALPFYWTWLGIAFVLGSIMSRFIIALIYFLVFTPMRLVGDSLGRDKLQLKKPQKDSYWLDISLPKEIEKYERQF